MSGPYRVAADLTTGVATEAKPAQFGDGARMNALTMPVTASRTLAPQELQEIRRLSSQAFTQGAFACRDMTMSMDALGRFDIVQEGVTHTSSAPTLCMTSQADALLRALTCGVDPTGAAAPAAPSGVLKKEGQGAAP